LLSTKAELTTAETAYSRSLQDYWTARSDLELALGTRVPETPLFVPEDRPSKQPKPSPPPTAPVPPNPHQQHQQK